MIKMKHSIVLAFVIGLNTMAVAQQNPEQQSTATHRLAFESAINPDTLFKVDSVEMSREEFERAVALGKIKSVEVLNDPNFTALFGDKARNGVVIVITKDRPSFAEEFLSRKKRIYPALD
jgi:hypothetical protein